MWAGYGLCGDDNGKCMIQRGRMTKGLRKAAQGIGVLAGGVAVFFLAMRHPGLSPMHLACAATVSIDAQHYT